MLNKFMNIAIKEAKLAKQNGFVPVGALIIQNNKIIAQAHNESFWHAEIICIQLAQNILGNFLNNCIIFSTVEPCAMCLHAIKLTRINTLVYGCENQKINNHKLNIVENIKKDECSKLIKEFFKNKR